MLSLWAWGALGALVRVLPPRLAYLMAARAMDLVHLAWRRGRGHMERNLRHVLQRDDPETLRHWSRRQLRRYGELLIDEARLQRLDAQDCLDALVTEQWPLMDAALRDDRPLLFALMHFGSWDVAGAALAARMRTVTPGRDFHVLVETVGSVALDRALQRNRRRLGMIPIDVERAPLSALRALRRGGAVGVLFDRPLGAAQPGLDLRLFDAPCRLPDGMARLALASEARVIPLALQRLPGPPFRFRPLVDFDFDYAPSGDRAADAQSLTQRVLDVHAGWIAQAPDQWYQFRPFFLEPAETSPQSPASAGASHLGRPD